MLKTDARKRFSERLIAAAQAHHKKTDKNGIATLIAGDFDVSIQTAAKWVRAATSPKIERWPEIANKYGVPVGWLAGSDATTPDAIASSDVLDHSHIDAVGKAARLALPLINKFIPDATSDQIAVVIEEAYRMIRSGAEERAVRGDIASLVVDMEDRDRDGENGQHSR